MAGEPDDWDPDGRRAGVTAALRSWTRRK